MFIHKPCLEGNKREPLISAGCHFHHLSFVATCVLFLKHKNKSVRTNTRRESSLWLTTVNRYYRSLRSRGKVRWVAPETTQENPRACTGGLVGAGWCFALESTGLLLEITPQILSTLVFKPCKSPWVIIPQLRTLGAGRRIGEDWRSKWAEVTSEGNKLLWVMLRAGNESKPLRFQFLWWLIGSLLYLIPNSAELFYAKEDAEKTPIMSR